MLYKISTSHIFYGLQDQVTLQDFHFCLTVPEPNGGVTLSQWIIHVVQMVQLQESDPFVMALWEIMATHATEKKSCLWGLRGPSWWCDTFLVDLFSSIFIHFTMKEGLKRRIRSTSHIWAFIAVMINMHEGYDQIKNEKPDLRLSITCFHILYISGNLCYSLYETPVRCTRLSLLFNEQMWTQQSTWQKWPIHCMSCICNSF